MNNYTKPKIDWKTKKKSVAIPDQSLSIKEIVHRYARGIPVDIQQRKPVYVDQDQEDLEKLNRMDFGEKAEYAEALKARNAITHAELQELQRSQKLAKEESEAMARENALQDALSKQRQPLDKQDGVN